MISFESMALFASHLESARFAQALEVQGALAGVAEAIRRDAAGKLGEYQDAVEHFDAWPELADATKQHHLQVIVDGDAADDAGENTPLLLTGKLRKSIKKHVELGEAIIGSTADEAVYQELGTNRIPPRPFLGPAVVENEELIREQLGSACVRGFLGSSVSASTEMTHRVIR